MKADVILLLIKIVGKNPFKDGNCIYCGGSENSEHYPDCAFVYAQRIVDKYKVCTSLPIEMEKEYAPKMEIAPKSKQRRYKKKSERVDDENI